MLPVIFMSDFGSHDPYVGQVKGVLAHLAPQVAVIDLFHDLPPYDITTAAWFIERTRKYMPHPAVWLCVVDPGVGSGRVPLIVEHEGCFFVGPDNGIFTALFTEGVKVHRIELASLRRAECYEREMRRDGIAIIPPRDHGNTFHGRDIFAPAAAAVAQSEGVDETITSPHDRTPTGVSWQGWERAGEGQWRARVMLIDHYGNLITGLPASKVNLPKSRVKGRFGELACGELQPTFSAVAVGQPALVAGGFETVEVVVNQGSAAEFTKAKVGSLIQIFVE